MGQAMHTLLLTLGDAPRAVGDLPGGELTDDLIKLALAMAVGGLIGVEREMRDKAAGFRTMILIAVGSALFTMLSPRVGWADGHQARIAAAVVTGIGFLGAGAIMRQGDHVQGLTTATSVWIAAALGMCAGAGEYALTLCAAGIVLLVLAGFPIFEGVMTGRRATRVYTLRCADGRDRCAAVLSHFKAAGLHVGETKRGRRGSALTLEVKTTGSDTSHDRAAAALLDDPAVHDVVYGASPMISGGGGGQNDDGPPKQAPSPP